MLLPHLLTSKLVENSSKILSFAHRIVPKPLQNHFVLYQLNHLAKVFMEDGELDFMEGKIARVELRDLSANWYFTKVGKRLVMLDQETEHTDVEFSGTLNAMVLMASQQVDPDTLFFNRDLKITGDTELGLEIKNLIDQFDLNLLDKPFRKVLDVWSTELLGSDWRQVHVQ